MLLNNLFIPESLHADASTWTATLRLVPEHPILCGHFPGQPVVPGVCMLDVLSELVAKALQREVRLSEASQVKFLQMWTPEQAPRADYSFTLTELADGWKVDAVLKHQDKVFLKFMGQYLSA